MNVSVSPPSPKISRVVEIQEEVKPELPCRPWTGNKNGEDIRASHIQ